ncbi:hypothetical protein CEW88_04825 [Alloyangia pacifica]|uniref:Transcriptional regulator n=1 Tax=Alloyangia pacifica TaxID=311180 RepID=A0A2U8HBB0_9RHOB|nr:hypothetical protein [Alloyangia pacifica]AWI83044.1 hypothetical protein CEW88_04825 [Alloyangia pacifica]
MSVLATAREAWGESCPDWIEALAVECDRTSQNQTAKRLERSTAMISKVLRNKYPADMQAIEDVVRGALMSETIACPALGDIGKQTCRKWRKKSRDFENVNSLYVQMFRACNRCPRNDTEKMAKGHEGDLT